MAVKFKQKCERCKTNYVTVSSWRQRRPIICYECEKKDMQGEIKDPELKKLLDIPEELYMQNSFLRAIKINCLRYGSLTQPQVDAFKKTILDIQKKQASEKLAVLQSSALGTTKPKVSLVPESKSFLKKDKKKD